MVKRFIGSAILSTMMFCLGVFTVRADTIYSHYFESVDVYLTENQFQVFAVSALQGEQVTIVVYGLEDGLVPQVSLLSPDGSTLVEDANQDRIAFVQATVPENGIYPFLVSRQSDQGGLVRVMVFEGEPLAEGVTLLDTADPTLPARAYLLAGNDAAPLEAQVETLTAAQPVLFASRGSTEQLPPMEERLTPIQSYRWMNDDGDVFYTINVRALPEMISTAEQAALHLKPRSPEDFRLTINAGTGPTIQMQHTTCQVIVQQTGRIPLFAGPGLEYPTVGSIAATTTVEVIGRYGDWLQIADANRLTGASWLQGNTITALHPQHCQRVQDVSTPPTVESLLQNTSDSEAGLLFLAQAFADQPDVALAAYQEVGITFSVEQVSTLTQLLAETHLPEAEINQLVDQLNGSSPTTPRFQTGMQISNIISDEKPLIYDVNKPGIEIPEITPIAPFAAEQPQSAPAEPQSAQPAQEAPPPAPEQPQPAPVVEVVPVVEQPVSVPVVETAPPPVETQPPVVTPASEDDHDHHHHHHHDDDDWDHDWDGWDDDGD